MQKYVSRCRIHRPDQQYWEVYVVISSNAGEESLTEAAHKLRLIAEGWAMLGWLLRPSSLWEWNGIYQPPHQPYWDVMGLTMGGRWNYPEGYDLQEAFEKFLRGE